MFQIRALQERDIEEATNILSKSFSQGEPMSYILGLTERDFYSFMKLYCESSINNDISFVCIDEANLKVCGVLICEDNDSIEIKLSDLNENLYKIFELLDEVSKDINKNKNNLHIFMCGVDETYRKQGIGKRLLNHLLNKGLDYDLIFAEATGTYSQKILTDLDFIMKNEILYSDTNDFQDIENKTNHKSLQLLIKE